MPKVIYLVFYVLLATPILLFLLKRLVRLIPNATFDWFVAKTYFINTKNKGFISLISSISLIGLILGSASVIIASSFMNGMQKEVTNRVIASDAHIKIRGLLNRFIDYDPELIQKISADPGIQGISPKVQNFALIASKQKSRPYPVIINGVDTISYFQINDVRKKMLYGTFDVGPQPVKNPITGKTVYFPGIVLGKYLADNLNLSSLDTGKLLRIGTVQEISFDIGNTKIDRAVYMGAVDLGFPEYDQTFAFTNLKAGQQIFGMGKQISYYDIKLKDEKTVESYATQIDLMTSFPMTTETWKDNWAVHLQLMEWEKTLYMVALSLIIMLASFNILSTLYMLVKDKTRDIGILRSMGLSASGVIRVFLNQGLMIGILGALGGIVLGLTVLELHLTYRLIEFPANTMILEYLPVDIHTMDIVIVSIFTIVISILASVYPAYIASKLKPVEAFRYE